RRFSRWVPASGSRAHSAVDEGCTETCVMRNRWVVLVLAFLGCAISGGGAAQDTGGTLAGRTVDAQGLPLPGVAVTVTGAQGAKTAVSDADGRFTVPLLTPGPYTVHAELQGFAPVDRTDIQVGLGQRIDLPLT